MQIETKLHKHMATCQELRIRVGETQRVRKFFWWPKKMAGHWFWFETREIEQTVKQVRDQVYGCPNQMTYEWRNTGVVVRPTREAKPSYFKRVFSR